MADKTIKQLLEEQHRASQRVKNQTKKIAKHRAIKAKFEGVVESRKKEIKQMRTGRGAATRWAVSQAGTVETPYGSNRGPKVSAWQQKFGIDGAPWCGAFVGNALLKAGVKVGPRIVYCPYIIQDGKAGVNGMLKIVPVSQAMAGDLVLFDWESNGVADHVGMVRSDYKGGGTLLTVEGNTSADNNGSQSNGGGVFLRSRPVFGGMTIVRPRY